MTRHRSTAYVFSIAQRGRAWKPDPITPQFRFVVRMAYACYEKGISYDVQWNLQGSTMGATLTASGPIPTPKPLPKPPRLRPVATWKPTIWDAGYRLEAYHDSNLKRWCPGFVIAHSCGLSLVHPSESDELGGADEDIRQRWLITHTASGKGFGLSLTFKRAADALLLAATFPVDWNQDADVLATNPDFRRAGHTVIAAYGSGHEKDNAKRSLERAA